jgi:hypothetical protein
MTEFGLMYRLSLYEFELIDNKTYQVFDIIACSHISVNKTKMSISIQR